MENYQAQRSFILRLPAWLGVRRQLLQPHALL